MIRVVNIRSYRSKIGEEFIKVDRSSVLGNPFYMVDESKRDEVCDKYEVYFESKLKDVKFREELIRIYRISLEKDIALGCWCSPKRCHGEVIKKFLDKYI